MTTPRYATPWAETLRLADADQRRRVRGTAHHEAGHATLMFTEGGQLLEVVLEYLVAGGRFQGSGGYVRAVGQFSDLAYAAGRGAEIAGGFDTFDRSDHNDRDLVAQAQRAGRGRCWNYAGAVRLAEAELRERWAAVRALAGALEAKGALGGPEAEVILAHLPEYERRDLVLRAVRHSPSRGA